MFRMCVVCVGLVAVGVGGCAKRVVVPPPETPVALGGLSATVRDFSRVDLCALDPALFHGDLESMSMLLGNLLGQTSAGDDGLWADEHIALLEQAQTVLPEPLSVMQRSLHAARKARCEFTGLTRAEELNAQALKRLADAPELLAIVKARKALREWREAQPVAAQAARFDACDPRRLRALKKPPVVYAFEDDKGRTEWHFCDTSKVVAVPGALPAWQPPPTAPKRKLPPADVYLEAVRAFDGASVQRAPRVPARVKKTDDWKLEPEPEPVD